MNRLISYLEDTFAAAAYAERGEHGTAREMARVPAPAKGFGNMLEDAYAAVGMAEGGLFDEALRLIGVGRRTRRAPFQRFLRDVGLDGAPLCYGIARV